MNEISIKNSLLPKVLKGKLLKINLKMRDLILLKKHSKGRPRKKSLLRQRTG
jgi:hypothetical protein